MWANTQGKYHNLLTLVTSLLAGGIRTSKTYNPHFQVPGSRQIVGTTFSGKTRWLSKLIQDAVTYMYCRDDTGDSMFSTSVVLLRLLLATYVHKNATRHGRYLSPRNTNHPLGRGVSTWATSQFVSARSLYARNCWPRPSDGFTQ